MNQQTKFKIVTLADFAKLPHGHRNKAAIAVSKAVARSVQKGLEIEYIDYDIKFKPRTVWAEQKLPKVDIKVTAGATAPIPTTEEPNVELVSLDTLTRRIMKNSRDALNTLCTENGIPLTDADTKATLTTQLIGVGYSPEGIQLEAQEVVADEDETEAESIVIMELRPYQNEGVKWLSERSHGLLGDEPGLGKTAQTIIAGDLALVSSVLVICPASARHNWADEVKKWSLFGHEVNIITESYHEPKEGMYNVVNYDKFSRALDAKNKPSAFLKKFTKIKWDLVVCDEAHLLKEKSSKRTKAILGQQGGIHGSTKRLWLLTGTPMPNHPGELWTVLCALGATTDSYSDFTKQFCVFQNYFQRFQPTGANPASAGVLSDLLGTVMLRRLKRDVAKDLPSLSIDDWALPAAKVNIKDIFGDDPKIQEVLAEQEEEVRQLWEKMDDDVPMEQALRAVKALGPMVSEYRRWLGVVKAESAAIAIREELEAGQYEKIVLFAHHKQVVSRLKEILIKYKPQVIDGSVSAIGRKEAVDTFQTDPRCRVFIGNIAAAGTAITLTAAAEVVVVEPDWVPANNAQAIQRCHRLGQTIPVRARMAKLADSLDNRISEVLRAKTADIISIVGNV